MKKNTILTTVIGIDLGDLRHAICVIGEHCEILEERTITNTRESLSKLAKQYPGARIAMEVGSHSPWISRLLSELGCEVIVANPRKLRAIYQNERKSDQLDARMLAKLARADVSLLYPVRHSPEAGSGDAGSVEEPDRIRTDPRCGVNDDFRNERRTNFQDDCESAPAYEFGATAKRRQQPFGRLRYSASIVRP